MRPETDRPPQGYYHLALEDFRRQLTHLRDEYGFVDRDAFVAALRGERPPPDGVVLTFDDALADHPEWVLPELRRRGLWGVFFVPVAPYVRESVLPVHRIHSLVSSVPATKLREELRAIVEADPSLPGDDGADDAYDDQSSPDDVSAVKRLLNFVLPPERVPGVLDSLEQELSDYQAPTVAEYYASKRQISALADAGMLVGAHSVTHPVLSRLDEAEQREEVAASVTWIRDTVGPQPATTFAYPFGSDDTFTSATVDAVDTAGCDAAFTTESGTVASDDPSPDTFRLPRRDCNEFPFGGATFDLP